MTTLKDTSMVPPEGFWYQQPETGVKLDGGSLIGTAEKVVLHRAANELPRQSRCEAIEDIQRQICHRVPSQFCNDCDHPEWRLSLASLGRAASALISIVKDKFTGESPFVEQDEADQRAARCANCFHNRSLGSCVGCSLGEALRKLFGMTIGDRKTASDAKIHGCEVCGCHCRTIVWYRKDIVNSGLDEAQRKEFSETPQCWRP